MTREEKIAELINIRDNFNYTLAPKEVFDDAIKALKQTRWIPVSERLPDAQKDGDKDFSDWVQVTIDIGRNDDNNLYVCEAYYCFSENKWYTQRFVIGVVTAWMPLPEPYWEEDEIRKAKIEYKKHLAKKRGKQEANE